MSVIADRTLADLLIHLAGRTSPPPSVGAIAAWLPRARRRTLSAADLQRIDAYTGDGQALHDMLPSVLPLAAPAWYEADLVAQHGTRTVQGYGATQAGPGEIDVWYVGWAPDLGRIIGPLGPLRMDSQAIDWRADAADPGVRELRAAAGIVVRALLLGL